MDLLIWIAVGGVLGWIASMIMNTDGSMGISLNIIVGIIGALIGGYLLAPYFGTSTINSGNFSLASMLVSLAGAVILLALVNLIRRGTVR
jgi:uncharacterized membrane protein YeaQ/YmgE (transglycosylase-associated protein family)